MTALGNSVALLTEELNVIQRAAIIDRFRAGKAKILVTTNLSARGIMIRLRREEESLDNVHQYYIECNDVQDKFMALANIYESITIAQAMVFSPVRRKP